MPFGRHRFVQGDSVSSVDFDVIYNEVIVRAIRQTGNASLRADEMKGSGDIPVQLTEKLVSSEMMIADLSMQNGNVYFELGIRQSMSHHPALLIAVEGTVLPFNIRNQRVLFYRATNDQECAVAASQLATWITEARTSPYTSPVQSNLAALSLAADPNDAASFEKDLRGKIERAVTLEQLNAVWSWAKSVQSPPPFALLELADKFARLKAWKTAASIIRLARDVRPGDYEIHRLLGWYLRNEGEHSYDEAEQCFREALRLNSGDQEALGMLGGLFKRQGRYPEAEECYEKGVLEAPDNLYLRAAHAGMIIMSAPSGTSPSVVAYVGLLADCNEAQYAEDAWANAVAGEAEFVLGRDDKALARYALARKFAESPTVLASPADQLRLFAAAGYRRDKALQLAATLDEWSKESGTVSATLLQQARATPLEPSSLPVIVHLSDAHFGYKIVDGKKVDMHRFRDGDYTVTLEQHLFDEFTSKSRPFDFDPSRLFFVVSGDIVYQAGRDEFQEAMTFCVAVAEKLQIDRERFIFCPGNHDVSWADAKIELPRRFDNYLSFLQEFYGEPLFRKLYPLIEWDFRVNSKRPEASDIVGIHDFDEHGISFISMNSCVYETDQNHYGFIGGRQIKNIRALLARRDNNNVSVAVLHHHLHPYPDYGQPEGDKGHWFDSSTIRDAGLVERFLERSGADIVLHGHKHKAQLRETLVRDQGSTSIKRLIVCGAGSSSVQSRELEHSVPNQYQVLEFLSPKRIPQSTFLRLDWRELPVRPEAEWTTSWSCRVDG